MHHCIVPYQDSFYSCYPDATTIHSSIHNQSIHASLTLAKLSKTAPDCSSCQQQSTIYHLTWNN